MIIMAEKKPKPAKEKASSKKEASPEKKGRKIDPWKVLSHPYLTEKSMSMVELENKLVFIVDRKFSKKDILDAIETQFSVKVADLRTVVMTDGKKKAIATLTGDYVASDIASKLGMM